MDYEKTGRLIAKRRHECGLTQVQLAEQIGVSNRAVSKWERGAGFPDVSLLEPLADALGITVMELLHGEAKAEDEESDLQVREAIRIVGEEVRKQLRRIRRGIGICLLLAFALLMTCSVGEFLLTNGDGFNPIENVRVTRQDYESNCRYLSKRGIFQIEVVSENERCSITDPDAIERLLEVLAQIEVGRQYKDWGPDSLKHKLLIHASGWTPDDTFIDTADYQFTLTFPVFSAEGMGDIPSEPNFYYYAEINDAPAWDAIAPVLRELSPEAAS